MAKGDRGKAQEAFHAAISLADSGNYLDVGEVEIAFSKKHPALSFPEIEWLRGQIDVTCLEARKKRGWDR